MENSPVPSLNLKAERRYSSNIGMALLIYAVLSLVLQFAGQYLLAQFAPKLLDNSFVFYTALLLPTYLLGTPICALTMRFSRPEKIEKKKLRPRHFFIAVLMCFPIMYAGNMLGTLVGTLADKLCGGQSGIAELITDSNPLANLIFVVILAPIVEEFIFRKLVVDRFVRYGELTAVLCSGLLFGLFHGNFYQFFYAAMLGMFFAFIYVKTGRLRITVLLHMIINFFGGLVGPAVLELLGPDYEITLTSALEILASEEAYASSEAMLAAMEEFTETVLPLLPGMLALTVYETLFFAAIIAGFVLLIVFRRRFKFSPGQVRLGSSAFSVTWVNCGIILFSIICAVLFALNLTA
ncbi:MAG: CPBP family intramembrane metalloprotease [Clostridia bacterium]|nr:CPBP family intramembrane metalloprotease [Clostridia bacterium]